MQSVTRMLKPRYWSDTAQNEFAALFEDADHAPVFIEKVADALIRGWPPNRDKPVWALALVVEALGRTAQRRPSGLEILAMRPSDVLSSLLEAAERGLPGIASAASHTAVRLYVNEASIVLSRTRLGLLRKIAEFLIAADGYARAAEVVATFETLARGPSQETLKEGVRSLARRLYEYRKTHFAEGHAASSFDYVRRKLGQATPTDADILALWTDADNSHFGTYRTAFAAALAFLKSRREVEERAAVTGAGSVDEPGNDRGIVPDDDGGGPPSPLALLYTADIDPGSMLMALKSTPLNVYTRAEVDFADLLESVWPDARLNVRSVLRLLAFHPIQSGLSNTLRTGRAKVPVEERVTCVEAATYREVLERIDALQDKTAGWLAAHYALTAGTPQREDRSAIARTGAMLLSRSRSKSFARPPAELAAHFSRIAPSLVALAEMTADVRGVVAAFDGPEGGRLQSTFADDREVFAAEFARRYLGRGGPDSDALHDDAADDPEGGVQ